MILTEGSPWLEVERKWLRWLGSARLNSQLAAQLSLTLGSRLAARGSARLDSARSSAQSSAHDSARGSARGAARLNPRLGSARDAGTTWIRSLSCGSDWKRVARIGSAWSRDNHEWWVFGRSTAMAFRGLEKFNDRLCFNATDSQRRGRTTMKTNGQWRGWCWLDTKWRLGGPTVKPNGSEGIGGEVTTMRSFNVRRLQVSVDRKEETGVASAEEGEDAREEEEGGWGGGARARGEFRVFIFKKYYIYLN